MLNAKWLNELAITNLNPILDLTYRVGRLRLFITYTLTRFPHVCKKSYTFFNHRLRNIYLTLDFGIQGIIS